MGVVCSRLESCIDGRSCVSTTMRTVELLLELCARFRGGSGRVRRFRGGGSLGHRQNVLDRKLESCVRHCLSFSVSDFVRSLVMRVVRRRAIITVTGVKGGGSSLEGFVLRSKQVILMRRQCPIRASPHVGSLFGFLRSVNCLSRSGALARVTSRFVRGCKGR